MKGVGCYAWDTPEIVRAKKSYDLQSDVSNIFVTHLAIDNEETLCFHLFKSYMFVSTQIKYKAEGKKEWNNYSIVTDTPAYVTAVLGHTWASEVRTPINLPLSAYLSTNKSTILLNSLGNILHICVSSTVELQRGIS